VSSTRISRRVHAPRARVYQALVDARAVATWKVPTGMSSHLHAFDVREGGAFRVSLTYDEPTGTGKTSAHTDTYHGRFVKLVTNERVVEVVEFETADPALRGEMTITITLADANGGTDILVVHDGLPRDLARDPGRNQIVDALPLADIAKGPIAASWAFAHALPADNASIGLPVPEKVVSNYVSALSVEGGAIHIAFGNRANNQIRGLILTLRPAIVADAPVVPVAWVCGYAAVPGNMTAKGENMTNIPAGYLPMQCR